MKKLYYLLLMVCTIGAFSACSDDDDDSGNNPPQNPVTEYSVPAQGEIGKDVTIKGKGYTAESKIFLKDAKGETEMTVKAHSSVDLVFTMLPTLTAGSYTVVLHQAGHSWDLGSIALVTANPVKDYEVVEKSVKAGETVNVKGSGWADKCRIYLIDVAALATDAENIEKTETGIRFTVPATLAAGIYTVMLEQTGDWALGTIEVVAEGAKKLSKIIYTDSEEEQMIYELFYNAEGKIDSVYNYKPLGQRNLRWKVTYGEGSVSVAVKGNTGSWVGEVEYTNVYTVANGNVTASYRIDAKENDARTDYTWSFSGDYLTECNLGDAAVVYTYEGDRLTAINTSAEDITLENVEGKTGENNFAGIDGLAFVLDYWELLDFEARLLGLTGKTLTQLPSQMSGNWEAYDVTYTTEDGLVTRITMVDTEDDTYTFNYTFTYK